MKLLRFAVVLLSVACLTPGFAGQRVQLQNMYERLVRVVPMVGAGTYEDPRRPKFAPMPGKKDDGNGIVAYSYQVSDDGRSAIVEFVARDREAFKTVFDERDRQIRMLPDERNRDVKVFEKGKHRKDEIEKEFRKHKKDFDLDRLRVAVP